MNQTLNTTYNPSTQCLQIGVSAFRRLLPSLSGAHCVEGFPILGGLMREHSQRSSTINHNPDYVDIDIQAQEYQKRCEREDARRFEEYTQNDVAQALARRMVNHA